MATYKVVQTPDLEIGARLDSPIYDSRGRRLLDAGFEITPTVIDKLQAHGIESVVFAGEKFGPQESPAEQELPVKQEPAVEQGKRAEGDFSVTDVIFAGNVEEVLVAAEGTSSEVAEPAATTPEVTPAEAMTPVSQETPAVPQDTPPSRTQKLRFDPAHQPFSEKIRRHGATPYAPETVRRFDRSIDAHARALGPFLVALAEEESADGNRNERHLADGNLDDGAVVRTITHNSLELAVEDIDLFAGYGADDYGADDYGAGDTASSHAASRQSAAAAMPAASDHSLQVARLAMAMGVNMGLREQALLDLGTGCMLHDIGMLRIRQQQRTGQDGGTRSTLQEMARHPQVTMSILLSNASLDMSQAALMVPYQMHERCNGSGYPRGSFGSGIHQLAKIAGVASHYVDLVMPRVGRRPSLPHQAVRSILDDLGRGLFDSDTVTALLQTLSAYPIGSYVRLSDDRQGQVIRTNDRKYTCPIVRIHDEHDPARTEDIVDLADTSQCEIATAVARPALAVA